MNSQRRKVILFTKLLFALLAFAVSVTLLIRAASDSATARGYQATTPQNDDKALDIDRYPNEPLQLIDLQIGEKSVKASIRQKSKDSISKWGKDTARFKEGTKWYRHVKVTLRNVSGRPLYGLSAELYFKRKDLDVFFGLPLTHTLEPNEEIDLNVSEESFNRAMTRMLEYAVNPDEASVTFSVDRAIFDDDFMWSRGGLFRRDPNDRLKWNRVDKPDSQGASQLRKQAGFTLIGFNPAPQFSATDVKPTREAH